MRFSWNLALLVVGMLVSCAGAALDEETSAPEAPTCDSGLCEPEHVDPPPKQYISNIFGVPQLVEGPKTAQTMERIKAMTAYMRQTVFRDESMQHVKRVCQNRDRLCAFWASIGECESNPAFMKLSCAPACFSCEQIDFETRCPMDNLGPDIWAAGDLNQMFEGIMEGAASLNISATALSRPGMDPTVLRGTPWIIELDDFLTDEECATLIQLGSDLGYDQSKDVGVKQFDGSYQGQESAYRTSTNTWCENACFEHDVTRSVMERIETLTRLPESNSEYLQLLRYEKGQRYHVHHDFVPHHVDRQQGPRIVTFFLYLNDVEEGGETYFPDMDLRVKPSRGKAIVWASVMDSDPNRKDPRTSHEALPVIEGVKYAANAWYHLRDFKEPHATNCV